MSKDFGKQFTLSGSYVNCFYKKFYSYHASSDSFVIFLRKASFILYNLSLYCRFYLFVFFVFAYILIGIHITQT